MNPEEFDKRLSQSFKNEHLQPDKKLWENISSKIDNQNKKSIWYWLIPSVIILSALGGWLMNGHDLKVNTKNTALNNRQMAGKKQILVIDKSNETYTDKQESDLTQMNDNSNHLGTAETNAKTKKKSIGLSNNNNQNTTGKGDIAFIDRDATNTIGSYHHENQKGNTIHSAAYHQADIAAKESDLYPVYLRINNFIPPERPHAVLSREEMIAQETEFKPKKAYASPYSDNPANFDSEWWWSAGLGPQITFNKAIIPTDSQAWVHKDLWSNKDKMTNNSSGFQSQITIGHTLGKHFSLEAGIQYSRHSEEINFNLTSYTIETRDSDGKITAYQDNVYLWFMIPGLPDTTWYQAARGFSLAVKNKYNIYTIPVKINFEYDISDKTKFYAGLGVGLTTITAQKSTHLSLTTDKEITEKKTTQLTASINGQFGFYTNFNDIGLLGIYSGYQFYTKPWEISNRQYAIRMSDLQLGISFRRPLNW